MTTAFEQWMATPWIVIAGMAAVTALTRYAGYWLLGRWTLGRRAEDALRAVPASVLTAIIAPTALATGIAESAATLVAIVFVWRFPPLAAIVGGVVAVVLLRQAF